jgi:hypothetical protein
MCCGSASVTPFRSALQQRRQRRRRRQGAAQSQRAPPAVVALEVPVRTAMSFLFHLKSGSGLVAVHFSRLNFEAMSYANFQIS